METEIWKDIPGYEGLYQVSNLGNIYSLPKKGKGGHNGKIMKLGKDGKGYLFTKLYKNYKFKNIKSHHAVMLAFVGEKKGMEVNHIDGNKENNKISNLEYCTRSENIKHAFNIGLNKGNKSALGIVGGLCKLSKKVGKYDSGGNLIEEGFLYDFNKKYGYDRTSIVKVCNMYKNQKTAYGFIWKYI